MKMGRLQINKNLLPMKGHYFLWNMGTGPVVPFLSVYARQLGLSSVVVGSIYTILPIFGMLAKPLFGAISDSYHCQKKIFLAAQLLTAAAFLAIFYVPKLPFKQQVQFTCFSEESYFNTMSGDISTSLVQHIQGNDKFDTCKLNCEMQDTFWNVVCQNWNVTAYCDSSAYTDTFEFTADVAMSETKQLDNGTVRFTIASIMIETAEVQVHPTCPGNGIYSNCTINCDDEFVNVVVASTGFDDGEVTAFYQFWLFVVLMVIGWIGQAIAVSIGDAICFEMLGEKHNRYGYQRMFGALGWGISSALAGVMMDAFSVGKPQVDYMSAFYMAVAFLLLDFIVSSTLQYKQIKLSSSIAKDIGRLLTNPRIIVYLLWCICVGMCTGLIWNFLLWLVEDLALAHDGTASQWLKTLQGILMGVQCLGGELPFFFLSGKILKKIGHINSMSLVLFVIGVRFILYSFITNPWWFIPVEFSNGLTFGLFYACMASYASIVAPPGTEATMQGLVGAVFEGVGVSLGSFLGGLAYRRFKGGLTFRYFGFGALIACVVHLTIQYMLGLKEAAPEYSAPNDSSLEKIPEEEDSQQEMGQLYSKPLKT